MADAKKPNILVILGDDIRTWNLSCYSGAMRGYRTLTGTSVEALS